MQINNKKQSYLHKLVNSWTFPNENVDIGFVGKLVYAVDDKVVVRDGQNGEQTCSVNVRQHHGRYGPKVEQDSVHRAESRISAIVQNVAYKKVLELKQSISTENIQ